MEAELEGTPDELDRTDEPGEVNYFTNLDTRHQDVNFNHTSDQGSNVAEDESARLNAAQGRIVGPGIVLNVSPGDKVDMEVVAKYLEEGKNYESRVASTSSALFGAFTEGLKESQKQVVGNALAGLPQVFLDDDNTAPRAYLNYIFFNKSYTFKLDQSGAKEISTAANGAFEKLELHTEIEEEGYLYIYVANESSADVNVFFDDLKVTHTETLVKSFTDYYPFGYTIAGLSGESASANVNKYLYMGKEFETFFNLDWTETDFRFYDPQIARFTQMDHLAGFIPGITPYQYAFNNPILTSDPTGLFPEGAISGKDPKAGKKPGQNIQRRYKPKSSSSSSSSSSSGSSSGTNAFFDFMEKADGFIYDDNNGRDFFLNWFPVSSAFNSGSKYLTGKGLDGTDADGWDYAFGWLDLLPEGAEIKLGAKYSYNAAVAIFIRKWAKQSGRHLHHMIPKAVYKDLWSLFDKPGFKIDDVENIFPVYTTFHGYHPKYSEYVSDLINNIASNNLNGKISAVDLDRILIHLEAKIIEAQGSGKRLNAFFDGLVAPNTLK